MQIIRVKVRMRFSLRVELIETKKGLVQGRSTFHQKLLLLPEEYVVIHKT